MVDPAVAYQPNKGYGAFDRGVADDIFLKEPNGTIHKGVVWPGVAVYPDWFHPKVDAYWTNEFQKFFNPSTGIDIDGVWIDMNEPASFCNYPCDNPDEQAVGNPPPRTTGPPDANTPIFQNSAKRSLGTRQSTELNYNDPPYKIGNALPYLGDHTAHMDIKHANGLMEYDTHNLYGTMMSSKTRDAMLARRPGKKPLIITRSTFAGAGAKVGKWLGDNLSEWEHYRFSIAGMLAMAGIYQVPMVGSDVCGFGANTTETLCARWAMLGAFYPFYRNHNGDTSISQEFYIWPTVAQAARNAISIRYQLMDYMYTAMQQAHEDGSPVLNSLWFKYPGDANTYGIDLQFFYGDSILVSPVTAENSTSVDIYLPKDTFYDFVTYQPVQGKGATVSLTNVNFTTIPVHIKGGSILPLRSSSAMTTKALREKDFNIVVAPGSDGKASGQLYIDDGVSLKPGSSTRLQLNYINKQLTVAGSTGFKTNSKIATVTFLGVSQKPNAVYLDSRKISPSSWKYDSNAKTVVLTVGKSLGGLTARLA
ncbi:Alpha-glucosidase family protein [Ceratobasidium theobromae]|uniref:Probable alpha/beta-glucosidase agdC n=1 Tax=Ceratobasidium theobromae TaxID=1582974 RepID=A0A5N5QMP1_9AGAM|nr:Alpha-glucosidase family protein [Ceratobasidium theobromae]